MRNAGKIKDYLNESFGWDVEFDSLGEVKRQIPFGFLNAADYSIIVLEEVKGLAIRPLSEEDFRATKNMATNLRKRVNLPIVLILNGLDSRQRKSLIENRISFIIPGKQVYLPSLGTLLNERGVSTYTPIGERLSPVASVIITYHLGKSSLQGLSITELAKKLGYSIKTLSIAVAELVANGLAALKQDGRKKLLNFNLSKSELWEKAFPLMDSPVEKTLLTTNAALAAEIGVKASDTALSELSMLAPPSQEIYAVYSRNPKVEELKLNSDDGNIVVELWKTDPWLVAKDGYLDVFSLALSYKDDDDPRVRKELNNIINKKL